MKATRVLVYGFSTYGNHRTNISERVLSQLKKRDGHVIVKTFPVNFNQRQFINAVRKLHPDFILGLGQHPRGEKLRIERRAINRFTRKGKQKNISFLGPLAINLSWKLTPSSQAWVSYDAGLYVCNFSMYIVGKLAQKKRLPFAFLHIPKTYVIGKAVTFVERQLDTIFAQ